MNDAIKGHPKSYVERVPGLGFMTAQNYMRLWFAVLFVCGLFFMLGQ